MLSRIYITLAASSAWVHSIAAANFAGLPARPPFKKGQQLALLVPHPDDEIIGCFHLLEWADGMCGIDLYYVTDHTDPKTAAVRSLESEMALANVSHRIKACWHLRDGALGEQREKLRERLEPLVGKYDYFICPAPNDTTPDHAVLGTEALAILPVDCMVWYRSTSWTFTFAAADFVCMGARDEKLDALRKFYTQRALPLQSGVYLSAIEAHHFGVKADSIEAFQLATNGLLADQPLNTLSVNATIKLSDWLCAYSR